MRLVCRVISASFARPFLHLPGNLRASSLLGWILCLSVFTSGMATAQSRPEDMVYLRSIDPSIEQDIRYASAHNFTGHPLDGYAAAQCLLTQEAAQALARVQKALRAQGYGLKVFDCYRPSRCLLYTSPSPRDRQKSRMPSSA